MAEIQLGVGSELGFSAAAASEPEEQEPFIMPRPRNRLVMWKHHQPRARGGVLDECPAIVTAIHAGMIDVIIFPSSMHYGQPMSGVKYCKDPSLEKMAAPNAGGVWDFTELEKRLNQLWAERHGELA